MERHRWQTGDLSDSLFSVTRSHTCSEGGESMERHLRLANSAPNSSFIGSNLRELREKPFLGLAFDHLLYMPVRLLLRKVR